MKKTEWILEFRDIKAPKKTRKWQSSLAMQFAGVRSFTLARAVQILRELEEPSDYQGYHLEYRITSL